MEGKGGMKEVVGFINTMFPSLGDQEKYALYGTLTGLNPKVMSYMVHGNGGVIFPGNS